ncbi:Eukaryotic translation initiation factor 5A [Mortierella sp. AM989]|nr:Eukaryotic translation initiation factor 5A [Mortierella sp. AM989]
MSDTAPIKCSFLHKGNDVVLNGRPCKIIDISTSDINVDLTGIDILTGENIKGTFLSTETMQVPVVMRTDYQLLTIDDGFLTLMDHCGSTRIDVKVPTDELGQMLQDAAENGRPAMIVVIDCMGESAVDPYTIQWE